MLQIALIKLLWQFCLIASCIILHICKGSWKRETGKHGTTLQHWKGGTENAGMENVGPNRRDGKRGTKFHRYGKCRTALYGTWRHFLGSAFVILSAVYGLRPAHRSLVSGDIRSHDPENNCIVSRRLRNAARVVARPNRIMLLLISRRLLQLPPELYSATQSQCLLFNYLCVSLCTAIYDTFLNNIAVVVRLCLKFG